jgi:DNA-binding MarR family transcriptional regulator
MFTGYLLRRAYVKAVGVTRACMPDDAHVREAALLAILTERGPLSQRELSDITHVNRTLIVKLVDTLEHKGWVRRERNAADRRSYALVPTRAGEQAHRDFTEDLDRGEVELTRGLTRSEVEELQALLTALLEGDAALSADALRRRTGYLVAHAHRAVREAAEGRMRPLGLHPRDFGALSILAEQQPCSQATLAVRMGVTPPAALGVVDDLESRGLVGRRRSESDRRVYDLTLSERGHDLLDAARAAAEAAQADIVARIGEDGDARLRDLLQKLLG